MQSQSDISTKSDRFDFIRKFCSKNFIQKLVFQKFYSIFFILIVALSNIPPILSPKLAKFFFTTKIECDVTEKEILSFEEYKQKKTS